MRILVFMIVCVLMFVFLGKSPEAQTKQEVSNEVSFTLYNCDSTRSVTVFEDCIVTFDGVHFKTYELR